MPKTTTSKQPTLRWLRNRVDRVQAIEQQVRDLMTARDAVVDEITARVPVGEKIGLGDGREIKIVDNFAGKRVHFVPAAARLYSLKVNSKKTKGKQA